VHLLHREAGQAVLTKPELLPDSQEAHKSFVDWMLALGQRMAALEQQINAALQSATQGQTSAAAHAQEQGQAAAARDARAREADTGRTNACNCHAQ
jgi:hypothetical protein